MPPTVALAPVQPTDGDGARWRGIITHWWEVAAPHGCHFENYRAQDMRFMALRPAPYARRRWQTANERSSPTRCPGILAGGRQAGLNDCRTGERNRTSCRENQRRPRHIVLKDDL